MEHVLPPLPYAKAALEPYISLETVEYHYGKHQKTYIDNLNKLIAGTEYADKTLEEIVKTAPAGGIFNNAAQAWNHRFYWEGFGPGRDTLPKERMSELIRSTFGSYDQLKADFNAKALANFGSGWTWLVQKADGSLDIVNTSNAATPLPDGVTPLLTCDVWEHAYYIDYRNRRADYLTAFWRLVDWSAIGARLAE